MKNIYSPLLWYRIPDYEGFYEINALGTIRSIEREVSHKSGTIRCGKKYLKSRINNYGYVEVRLSRDGKTKTYQLHRLLAFIFIPKPNNKNEVNHKDGIKTNNNIDNLEWVTHSENVLHAFRSGLYKTLDKSCRKVKDVCTGKVFNSAKRAADFYAIPYSTCKNYLNGNRPNPTCLQYES